MTLNELADRVEAAIPKPITDEWREHDGFGRPHPPVSYVQIEFRDGRIESGHSACIAWPWSGGSDDIIRWRFAPEPMSRVRAGELLIDNAKLIAAALRARSQEAGE